MIRTYSESQVNHTKLLYYVLRMMKKNPVLPVTLFQILTLRHAFFICFAIFFNEREKKQYSKVSLINFPLFSFLKLLMFRKL